MEQFLASIPLWIQVIAGIIVAIGMVVSFVKMLSSEDRDIMWMIIFFICIFLLIIICGNNMDNQTRQTFIDTL